MTPLEKHINLMAGYARFQAEQSDLAPLMICNAAPGQRALVYRNSGMLGLVGALRSNYPCLEALMGEAFFSEMAKAYIHNYPPVQRSLVGYGGQLADFIDAQVAEHKLVWLGDLARLDRAWLEAHLAADAAPLPLDQIAEVPQEKLLTALLEFHCSLRIVETRWDIAPLWLKLKSGNIPDAQQTLDDSLSVTMFWRPRGEVIARALLSEDRTFLQTLLQRKTLNEACSNILETDPYADLAVLIAGIVSAGLITDLIFEEAHTYENP